MPQYIELQVEIIAEFLAVTGLTLHRELQSQAFVPPGKYQPLAYDPEYHFGWGMYYLALAERERNNRKKGALVENSIAALKTGATQTEPNTEGHIGCLYGAALGEVEKMFADDIYKDSPSFDAAIDGIQKQLNNLWSSAGNLVEVVRDTPRQAPKSRADLWQGLFVRQRGYVEHIRASVGSSHKTPEESFNAAVEFYSLARDTYRYGVNQKSETFNRHKWMAQNRMPIRYKNWRHRFVWKVIFLQDIRWFLHSLKEA